MRASSVRGVSYRDEWMRDYPPNFSLAALSCERGLGANCCQTGHGTWIREGHV